MSPFRVKREKACATAEKGKVVEVLEAPEALAAAFDAQANQSHDGRTSGCGGGINGPPALISQVYHH